MIKSETVAGSATFAGRPLVIDSKIPEGALYVHPGTLYDWGILPIGKRTPDGKYVVIAEALTSQLI